MQRLSPESIAFLRRIQHQGISRSQHDTWSKHYTRLFSDLYEIINEANKTLNNFALGKWNISYESMDSDKPLAFEYALKSSELEASPSIKITIEPVGISTIELTQPEHLCPVKSKTFYQSSAYKRYFEPHQTLRTGLKTVIAQRQLTSRHLGSYIKHLLTMMKPYLEASCQEEKADLVAA